MEYIKFRLSSPLLKVRCSLWYLLCLDIDLEGGGGGGGGGVVDVCMYMHVQ